jgi:hypothetical protein
MRTFLWKTDSKWKLTKFREHLSQGRWHAPTTLKPGDYKVEWENSGSNVEVSIMQGKSVLAKTTAHQVELAAPASNDAIVIVKNDNGTSSLTGLRFEGKKFGLELGESTDGMQVGSSK